MLRLLIKLISLLDTRVRLELLALVVPTGLTAVLEMLSIGLIIPLVQAVFGLGGSMPWSLDLAALLPGYPPEDVARIAVLAFAAAFLLKNAAILVLTHLINATTQRNLARFQTRLFDLYLRMPFEFFITVNTAELQRNLLSSTGLAFDGLRIALSTVMEAVLVVVAIALLLRVEPAATLGAAGVLLVFGFLLYRLMGPRLQEWGRRGHWLDAKVIQSIRQGFGSIRDIKVLHCHAQVAEEFSHLTDEYALYVSRGATAQHIPRLMVEMLLVIGFLVVLLTMAATRQGLTQDVIPVLGLFGMAALRLMPSLNRILSNLTTLRQRVAAIDALAVALAEGARGAEPETVPGPALAFSRTIELDKVGYRYPAADRPALEDVDLRIAKGESIGLVGSSGAGKSTLVDVILGLLRPSRGAVRVDGSDVSADLTAWQRLIGYVPQQIVLTDDTLMKNVAFGVPPERIDETRVREALRLAHLSDVVAGLPDGLQTMLGENGLRLSGGQRQRVGIARALYRDLQILVLDEATSALDNESERAIGAAIASLAGSRTMIIIAHRLSTVRDCDRIVVLDQGRVVDSGRYDELLERSPQFRRLALPETGTTTVEA